MDKLTFTVSCKNKHEYQSKQALIKFYDDLPIRKQTKFMDLIQSLKTILKDN